ncbi:hypothetical protein BDY17DRAFT_300370 [Neohortaea acidophila]|uniref:Uncharacterized protein n=1 Tax=Neohortaea acidophila TaxID=245834 RepID=A0A6A6PRQ1_9PEZI|nr:uncharacterized protein BDY17DRAFT_300370 [Neohortaea acidophila]KAF2482143.1 hypothetical protein BDY17DRAFT_300370 [Neohortaea acidophila]
MMTCWRTSGLLKIRPHFPLDAQRHRRGRMQSIIHLQPNNIALEAFTLVHPATPSFLVLFIALSSSLVNTDFYLTMAGRGLAFWLPILLLTVLLKPMLVQGVTDCTGKCWIKAITTAARGVCAEPISGLAECICNGPTYYAIFMKCDAKCKKCGDWDGLAPYQLCGSQVPLQPVPMFSNVPARRDAVSAHEAEVALAARPTDRPFIGWCGPPGSPCFIEDSINVDVDKHDDIAPAAFDWVGEDDTPFAAPVIEDGPIASAVMAVPSLCTASNGGQTSCAMSIVPSATAKTPELVASSAEAMADARMVFTAAVVMFDVVLMLL